LLKFILEILRFDKNHCRPQKLCNAISVSLTPHAMKALH
jgi:hypothetical protein